MLKQKHSLRSVLSLVILLIAGAIVGLGFINRQLLYDYATAAQYKPSSSEGTIEKNLHLTELGSLYFKASATKLETATSFNKNCEQSAETNNPILGCCVNNRIFVYKVTNDKLDGIEQTTAAHELLHAAYQRMPASERARVDKQVQSAYEKVKNPELDARVAYYDKAEPGQKLNELHSILGTEFYNLGTALENHYLQFFKDRRMVVNYYDQYSAVFHNVTNRLTKLSELINQQTAQVNTDIDNYNKAVQQLNSDVKAFNAKNESNGFTTQADFNNAQQPLTDRQHDLDAKRQSIEAIIQSIGSSREEYNQLVYQYNELNNSINSKLAPSPSLSST